MAKKIKLSTEELERQSSELLLISEDLAQTKKQIDSVLKTTNEHWTKNLANSFVTKISSLNKSLVDLSELLEKSSKAASDAAKSYQSIESQMLKMARGAELNGKINKAGKAAKKQVKEDLDQVKDGLNEIESYLKKNLSKEQREAAMKIIKKLCGSGKTEITQKIIRIFQGKFTHKDFNELTNLLIDEVCEDSAYAAVFKSVIKKFNKYTSLEAKYEQQITQALLSGNYKKAGTKLVESVIQCVFVGSADVGYDALKSMITGNDMLQQLSTLAGVSIDEIIKKIEKAAVNAASGVFK